MPIFLSDESGLLTLLLVIAALAGLITTLVTIFFRRRRSRMLLVERVAELEALSNAGRALLATELDLEALTRLIAEQAGQVIDNHTFQLGLFNDGFYEILYWTIDGVEQPTPQSFALEPERSGLDKANGLVGWVRDTRQSLLVRDFNREMDTLPAQPTYESDTPPRSALFLPLISGERTIGLLAAQSQQPNHFSEQDLRRLTILANQAAAAIANAQLFTQERMRAAHLELVTQIARQVNAVNELDEILEQVVVLTRQTFGFHPVSVFGVRPENNEVVIQSSTVTELNPHRRENDPEKTASPPITWAVRLPIGQGIVGSAAASRQTVVANCAYDDARFLPHLDHLPPELKPQTQAEIAIPLIVNEELLGVLDVQSPMIGAFGSTEQVVLETLAAEAATAIYKAQQLSREQEQAWITTAQLQVAETISRHDDLSETLTAVALLAPILIGVDLCGFLLWDEVAEAYYGITLVNNLGDEQAWFKEIHLAIGDWGSLDAVHVGQEVLTTTIIPDWLRSSSNLLSPEVGCLQLHPLLSAQAHPLGVMFAGLEKDAACPESSGQITAYNQTPTTRQAELLRNIARQTSQAIESAHLRIAQQEEAWVNTVLLQVAEAVNSLTDLNEILDTIVRLVPMLVGVDSVFILVWDESRQLFQAGPSHGVSAMGRGLVETLEIDRDEFLSMSPQLAADFNSPRLPGSAYYPLRVPVWLETVLNTSTAYNFPLIARGRLVGAKIVGLRRERLSRSPFTSRRISILNGIAQQAATAVVNNQLYRESADRARMQQELDVARSIQTSFLPDGSPEIPGCSVATMWQAARQVGGDFYDFLPLDDDKWGIVIADVADKGVPAALFMALSRTILRTVAFNREDPAHVLMRTNEIIAREAKSDLFVTVFYGVWDPASERLTYANAGHNPPILMQPNGAFHTLQGNGVALGILPDIQLKSYAVTLHPGETVLLYTDGITEALNEDFDEFGLERLRVAARTTSRKPATEIVRHIADSIADHAGETPQFDDMTLIVIKRQAMKSGSAR
jgi:serine phosphatase RsbU (regulator of sigma subunit)/putative methionine-R-sulfoxide reductase with GAF domain